MDEAAWIAIVSILGTLLAGMLIPIATGGFVRRAEYDKVQTKLEHEQELRTIQDKRIEEKDKAIQLIEHQRDMLENKADIATDVLTAIRAAVQGGGK